MNAKRVRIHTINGITRVVDIESGLPIPGVTAISIEAIPGQPTIAHVTQRFRVTDLDMPAFLKSVEVVPTLL